MRMRTLAYKRTIFLPLILASALACGFGQQTAQSGSSSERDSASGVGAKVAAQVEELQSQLTALKAQVQAAQDAAEKASKSQAAAETAATNAAGASNTASGAAKLADKASSEASGHAAAADSAATVAKQLSKTATQSAQKAVAAAGVVLNGSTDVSDAVKIQAVLLPAPVVRKVFSGHISENYAVVQLTISNQSKTSAFVVQTVMLDYSSWLFSGLGTQTPACDKTQSTWFQTSCPGQVGSVESRVIRDQLQDASLWTVRNSLVRGMILVGSLASGFAGIGPKGFEEASAGFNGNFIPGLQAMWPDQTIAQLNHVSDLGFQTNKLIAKESADIVYAFFPLDRFLTPGLKRIFISAPALYYAPQELFFEPRQQRDLCTGGVNWITRTCVNAATVRLFKVSIERAAGMIPVGNTSQDPESLDAKALAMLTSDCTLENSKACESLDAFIHKGDSRGSEGDPKIPGTLGETTSETIKLKQILEGLSLNNLHLQVGGMMTVNENVVPPNLSRITFENDQKSAFGKACTPQNGTIEGQFLSGGIPSLSTLTLPDGDQYKGKTASDFVDSISLVSEKSNDLSLNFSMVLKNPIPPKSVLKFVVTKYDPSDTAKKNGIKSAELAYPDSGGLNYDGTGLSSILSTDSCALQKKSASAAPTVAKAEIDPSVDLSSDSSVGKPLSGTITGTGLQSATALTVKALAIGSEGKQGDVASFLKSSAAVVDGKSSTDTQLKFTLTLKKAIPVGSRLTLEVSTPGGKAEGTLSVPTPKP